MDEIKSALELKQLVYPALTSKKYELKRLGYNNISQLKEHPWMKDKDDEKEID